MENRVKNIKKQFEQSAVPHNIIVNKNIITTEINKNKLSSSSSSYGIKRSPAFRCNSDGSNSNNKSLKNRVVTNKVQIFEEKVNESNYLDPKFRSTGNLYEGDVDLQLHKPLPPGPPPKKPPRTFAHTNKLYYSSSPIINYNLNSNGQIRNNSIAINNKQHLSGVYPQPNRLPNTNNFTTIVNKTRNSPQRNELKFNRELLNNGESPNNRRPKGIYHSDNSIRPIALYEPKPNTRQPLNRMASKSLSPQQQKQKQKHQQPIITKPFLPRSKTESQIILKNRSSILPLDRHNNANTNYYCEQNTTFPPSSTRSRSQENIYAIPFNADPNTGIPVKNVTNNSSPLILTSTGKQGLYYMSSPVENWNKSNNTSPKKLPLIRTPPPQLLISPKIQETQSRFLNHPPEKPKRNNNNNINTRTMEGNERELDVKIKKLIEKAFTHPQSPDGSSEGSTDLDSLPNLSPRKVEPEESEEELRKEVEKRKVYVRRTSSVAVTALQVNRFKKTLRLEGMRLQKRLFNSLLLVGLEYNPDTHTHKPYIKSLYPENANTPAEIEKFIFPDCNSWPPASAVNEHRTYSIILTDEEGTRTYAYCRRILPEGAAMCIPLAYCIVSNHLAAEFYYKVLEEIESLHGQNESVRLEYLKNLYTETYPGAGTSFKNIKRPPDLRLECKEFAILYNTVSNSILIKVISSILHERKLILISSSLHKVTSVIFALNSLLYPFQWRHTIVTALPHSRLELCDAPIPFIFGILKNIDGSIPHVNFDMEGMILDIDSNKILLSMDDEDKILPTKLRRGLRTALSLVSSSTEAKDAVRNVLVAEVFIRMFVELCGHYLPYVKGNKQTPMFDKIEFIRVTESKSHRNFLEWFTETAMFHQFKESVLIESKDLELFRGKCINYIDNFVGDNSGRYPLVQFKNFSLVAKKNKSLGDRFKEWGSNF